MKCEYTTDQLYIFQIWILSLLLQDIPINATDADVDAANRDIQYSLSGDGNTLFKMDPLEADIIVNDIGSIDCEKKCEYNLLVSLFS